ncbi:uncharacterized protein F5Z01DRAFT_309610 [Emericellopsis atlantica]|uniref:Uncharacterized protein n=1 Tax=Emericellopsis atlantica TaxID=2614577 RepID=A0A9P7ZTD8_9HYPO|nr:uncharacterized protein F5Z01DRAFT_309610 [Emericellopsis atlantica]KAG9257920.1 hypothetical protein F5Z01DRAFT_309610 [Emericellopsis atlantica]
MPFNATSTNFRLHYHQVSTTRYRIPSSLSALHKVSSSISASLIVGASSESARCVRREQSMRRVASLALLAIITPALCEHVLASYIYHTPCESVPELIGTPALTFAGRMDCRDSAEFYRDRYMTPRSPYYIQALDKSPPMLSFGAPDDEIMAGSLSIFKNALLAKLNNAKWTDNNTLNQSFPVIDTQL